MYTGFIQSFQAKYCYVGQADDVAAVARELQGEIDLRKADQPRKLHANLPDDLSGAVSALVGRCVNGGDMGSGDCSTVAISADVYALGYFYSNGTGHEPVVALFHSTGEKILPYDYCAELATVNWKGEAQTPSWKKV